MFIIQGPDGKEYGPVTTGNVGEWLREGRATLQTPARRPTETAWQPLASFAEFSVGRPRAATVPPFVATTLAQADADLTPADEAPPANLWLRLAAALVDGFLKILCFLPTTIPLTQLMIEQAKSGAPRSFTEVAATTREVLNATLSHSLPFLAALLVVQVLLLTFRGQSVGKLLLGLRIVRVPDNSAPGFVHGVVLRSVVPFLLEQVPVAGFFFWIVDSAFVFRPDRRCVHDLLAGTRVVSARTEA